MCSGQGLQAYKGTEEDVDNGDEGLSDEQTLPEVHRTSHLRQEGNEHDGTRVGV